MSEFRVPKRQVEVELSVVGVGKMRLSLFLSEFASHHEGSELVSDLFNGDSEFIAGKDVASGRAVVIRRGAALLVRVPREFERNAEGDYEREVTLTLEDGQSVSGVMSYVMPPESSRPVDYLNDGAPLFFPVRTGDEVALVNKSRVSRVELISKD